MMPPAISDDDLHAYVDGALTAERRRAVEEHLAADAEAAARVAAYRAQKDLLHTLYDSVLDEPVPSGLRPVPRTRYGRRLALTAAAVLLFSVGGAAGWWLRGAGQALPPVALSGLAHHAAVAYAVFSPEVRHPVEVGAEEERHLVAWLSKRLNAEVKAPALTAQGFSLVGGRLLSDASGPAALFMYEDERGGRLTLYVRRQEGGVQETAFRYAHENGIGVFYWIDRELSYALAGRLKKQTLLELSRAIYDQLYK